MRTHLFKMDWVLLSIVILCIVSAGLYKVIGVLEKMVMK